MAQTKQNLPRHRGRLFPEFTISPEELERQKAEKEVRSQRYRQIFALVSPELLENHYNWFMAIEPNSGDYFIDPNEAVAVQKARQKYPHGMIGIMRLNETGACGMI